MERTDSTVTTDHEEKFAPHELFFSITKSDSTILAGNNLFVRISGYSKEELIGSYHNIIRHPDMPRIVFKTFWEYLNAGKPIVAYVKNRTKEGGFYWVLAAVFPMGERYVSIRLKPTSPLFVTVKEIYAKLIAVEQDEGIAGSEKLLSELLHEAGHENYGHFMSAALLQELERRISCTSGNTNEIVLRSDADEMVKLHAVYDYSKNLMDEYDQWFEKIDMFLRLKSGFEEKGVLLRHLARDIVFLSLNASVSSYKIEKGGETFGVIANDIRITAKENETLINRFYTVIHDMTESLNAVVFSVAAMRLQIEMVRYFIQETVSDTQAVHLGEVDQNIGDLVRLVEEYGQKSKKLQLKLDVQIQQCSKYLDNLEQQMLYLGYVQTYGIIEAAGNQDETTKFGVIFSQLKGLIHKTSYEVEIMQKMGKNFYFENRTLIEKSKKTDRLVKRLHEETFRINKGDE